MGLHIVTTGDTRKCHCYIQHTEILRTMLSGPVFIKD